MATNDQTNKQTRERTHERGRIELMHIPPRSPDLNPIERYWAWLRKRLRYKDLADLRAGRPLLNKFAMKARVKALVRTRDSKKVAKRHFLSFRKTCALVAQSKGAHSGK